MSSARRPRQPDAKAGRAEVVRPETSATTGSAPRRQSGRRWEREFLTDALEENEDYFVWVSREPYKQLSPVVEAFSEMNTRLVVVRDGPDRDRLGAVRPPTRSSSAGATRARDRRRTPSRRSFASNTATPLARPSGKKALAHSGQAACH